MDCLQGAHLCLNANDHRESCAALTVARGQDCSDQSLFFPSPDETMIELKGLAGLLELIPGARGKLACDPLRVKKLLRYDERFRFESNIIDMIVPIRMLPEPGNMHPPMQLVSEENLEKARHGPANSRRPKLSIVGQASRAGSGFSKATCNQTAVGSPGFSETRQVWPVSIGLPEKRPNNRSEDQFWPRSTISPPPPVGVWKTRK